MTSITDITAQEIQDSRGKPTITVTVRAGDAAGTFAVPSGASTGSAEAFELRDADGHMHAAIRNLQESVRPALLGHDVNDQAGIDRIMRELDGTPNKSHLGGNVLIGASIATAKAAATVKNVQVFEHLRSCANIAPSRPVPYLYSNYINGGKHASSPLSFQEHMLVPDTDNVRESIQMLTHMGSILGESIQSKYGADAMCAMGDEGGYVIPETDPRVPFELLFGSIRTAGYEGRVRIATDVAASSFYKDGVYTVGGRVYSVDELIGLYKDLAAEFPLISIEDPFNEDAFEDFARLQKETDSRIVGDDLTVTNAGRLARAIGSESVRAIIIKPNQIGTLTEVFDTMKLARDHGIDCIVSHRSGETMDDFVADLAYAFGVFGLKAGALRKPERRAKYDRLAILNSSASV